MHYSMSVPSFEAEIALTVRHYGHDIDPACVPGEALQLAAAVQLPYLERPPSVEAEICALTI